MSQTEYEFFLVAPPGHEAITADEARSLAFRVQAEVAGGVTCIGDWREIWRANLALSTPVRVLVRLGSFRAFHLAQLDKRARKFPWGETLRPDVPLRVDVTTHASKIYHAGAAKQRVERALTEELGALIAEDAPLTLKVRIDDDLVTFSLDSTGEALHKRGYKVAIAKAPLRETLAASFLHQAGFDPNEPLIDPMCGSGTLVLEAASQAMGFAPGRMRDFAFQNLASFDPAAFAKLRASLSPEPTTITAPRFFGYDRDDGAIRASTANAERAGVSAITAFNRQPLSALTRPEGIHGAGLILTNPPWGARIGERKLLFALYGSFGQRLREEFKGWRIGIIAPDAGLVKATGLGLTAAGAPVDIGGIKASLWLGAI